MKYKALSVVHPGGQKIASGEKTIEVRSWKPPALVKIKKVRDHLETYILAACASRWDPNYYSWELTDIRPIVTEEKAAANRGIYEVDLLTI